MMDDRSRWTEIEALAKASRARKERNLAAFERRCGIAASLPGCEHIATRGRQVRAMAVGSRQSGGFAV